jgi:hypothetical protein
VHAGSRAAVREALGRILVQVGVVAEGGYVADAFDDVGELELAHQVHVSAPGLEVSRAARMLVGRRRRSILRIPAVGRRWNGCSVVLIAAKVNALTTVTGWRLADHLCAREA